MTVVLVCKPRVRSVRFFHEEDFKLCCWLKSNKFQKLIPWGRRSPIATRTLLPAAVLLFFLTLFWLDGRPQFLEEWLFFVGWGLVLARREETRFLLLLLRRRRFLHGAARDHGAGPGDHWRRSRLVRFPARWISGVVITIHNERKWDYIKILIYRWANMSLKHSY